MCKLLQLLDELEKSEPKTKNVGTWQDSNVIDAEGYHKALIKIREILDNCCKETIKKAENTLNEN